MGTEIEKRVLGLYEISNMGKKHAEVQNPRSIRNRSVSGIRWTTAQTFFLAILGPIAQIVKARFLSPEELGVVAVYMIVYGLLRTVENAGIGQSIVQKDVLDSGERLTYLVVTAGAAILGASGLVLMAGPVAMVFRTPQAAALLRWAGPLLFLALIDQYFRALLHRELLFGGAALLESGKRLLNLLLLFVFFAMGFGPLGVAYAMVSSAMFGVIGLLFITKRSSVMKLKFEWSSSAIKHLMTFGMPIAGKQIFTYITHRADEFIIGLLFDAATLGMYHLAKETLQRLLSLITSSFSRVLLPLFSRIRSDQERLTRVYGDRKSVV